jgi:hypothetical protein
LFDAIAGNSSARLYEQGRSRSDRIAQALRPLEGEGMIFAEEMVQKIRAAAEAGVDHPAT